MRILYYNWVDYLDDEHRGGGVSVYQRNLMHAWDADPTIRESFLSSGISYDLFNRAPRWERLRHGPEADRDRRFEIVNSGVLSPAHFSFGSPHQIAHAPTTEAFFDFIDKTGPYDVIHFNNLEGLPIEVLKLKEIWHRTRVVVTLHNYYPFCPQVNLWQREAEHCADFKAGAACANCLVQPRPDARLLRGANGLAYHLKCAGLRPGSRAFDLTFRQLMRAGRLSLRAAGMLRRRVRAATAAPRSGSTQAQHFAARRKQMVAALNAHADQVLCVSGRVREIAAQHGLRPELLRTSYIGSAHARHFAETHPADSLLNPDGTLSLAYLGYMRRDKGFFFLLNALEALPEAQARRLHLLVAARSGPPEAMARLAALRPRLASLTHVDGYRANDLDHLLADTRLGLIPVLWEDNLPQVAIEMHARHIALLTSNRGGASELGRFPALIHDAGSIPDFHRCLQTALNDAIDLRAYWAGAMAPVSMPEHLAQLRSLYQEPA
ncbi:glycosyltransferase [Pseudothioclava arenosa]|uniref:Glycosyltransferase n=1 Tax=Pseudothioclava arenosa TaxID=1795308 RepID=A0A2A4CKA4_9RHOB|nr:glycosyltransferase [Pseudothioclava arenosa]PCD76453.1 glycosyltransferase [Pseudothioclava arenosa]